jgi:hypothetical protein
VDAVLAESPEEEGQPFVRGLTALDQMAARDGAERFLALSPPQALAFVQQLEADLIRCTVGHQVGFTSEDCYLSPRVDLTELPEPHRPVIEFYLAAKCLLVTGYCTSEPIYRVLEAAEGGHIHGDYAGCTHPEHKT